MPDTTLNFFEQFEALVAPLLAGCPEFEEEPSNVVRLRPGKNLRLAVRVAIQAYEKSGLMLDAALTYAAHGFPVVPLGYNSKTPQEAPRDPDPTGEFEDGIPGTGGVYKATVDPLIIRDWWKNKKAYLIGLPMGAESDVWTLDVDTSEDHADGVAQWNAIAAQHAPIITREHRSATGGPHLIFNWKQPIGNSIGSLPKNGISVKGQGGYIVVPPSRRKKRSYTVFRDINPTDAPSWLLDLILQGRTPSSAPYSGEVTADLEEVAELMTFIPNDDLNWEEWKNMGMRIYASTSGQGFEVFDAFSKLSISKYNAARTRQAWDNEIRGSPPTRTGVEKLRSLASENGWEPKLKIVAPAKIEKQTTEISADAAREEVQRIIHEFLYDVAMPASESNVWLDEYFRSRSPDWPIARALRATTGIGKSDITTKKFAAWLQLVNLKGPIIYAVQQHELSSEIEQRFATTGIKARIFHGRTWKDPNDETRVMCKNPLAVELATKCHADVATSCCYVSKNKKCPFFDPGPKQCEYQSQQIDAETVQVWIPASDMLFQTHKAFGKPAAVIVDESIWRKGVRGIADPRKNEPETRWIVSIDRLLMNPEPEVLQFHSSDYATEAERQVGERDLLRHRLGKALLKQTVDGWFDHQYLDSEFTIKECSRAIILEFALVPKLGLEPGIPTVEIKKLAANKLLIAEIRRVRRIIKVWQAVRQLLRNPKIVMSGNLILRLGKREVEWRGVEAISKQFWVPTLMLDATLPSLPILQVNHPQVEIVADIKVALPPHVHIQQVLHAPTSSKKLDLQSHLDDIWRYVMLCWIEAGRVDTLVTCQLKVEIYLEKRGLPDNIKVAHFNNLTGVDVHREVGLHIQLGRTAPGPREMETLGAALSGAKPTEVAPGAKGFIWYPSTKRAIKLRDGRELKIKGDLHPDAFIDDVRWLVHEGEGIQGEGRSRPVNRTAKNPLIMKRVFDTALPIPVDEVVNWKRPSLLSEMLIEGVMLASPVDMVKAWPQVWANDKAADRSLRDWPTFEALIAGWRAVTYQLTGAKMNLKRRTGFFDHARIDDPRTWLEARLGPLKLFNADTQGQNP